MDIKKLELYATLKKGIKSLEAQIEELLPEVTVMMIEAGKDEVTLPTVGKFYFTDKCSWTYPLEIEEMAENLKAKKKAAEQKGYAVSEVKRIFSFRGEENNDERASDL